MSDNIKIVIEIPAEMFQEIRDTDLIDIHTLNASIKAIAHGIPLDDVKAEIKTEISDYEGYADFHEGIRFGLRTALKIMDKHIGKESEESNDKET